MTDVLGLGSRLAQAESLVPVGTLWTHYRGATVVVLGHGLNEQTGEAQVQYRHVCDGVTWHRPLSSWLAHVRDGETFAPRFVRSDARSILEAAAHG